MQDGIRDKGASPTVKRKKPALKRLSSCFSPRFHSFEISSSSSPSGSPKWSPSSWFHSKPHDNNSLDLKQSKNRQLTPRIIGRNGRRHSADFSYDPRSYALNFDDGKYPESDKFADRLPASPPRRSNDITVPSRSALTPAISPDTWISSVKRRSADVVEESAVTARTVVNGPPPLALQILV